MVIKDLMRCHLITPFSRAANFEPLHAMLTTQGVYTWMLIGRKGENLPQKEPLTVSTYLDIPDGEDIGLLLLNKFIQQGTFINDDRYGFFADDDYYPPGLIQEVSKHGEPIIITSMLRGDKASKHPCTPLPACRENLSYAKVGMEQAFFRGDVLNWLRDTIKGDEPNELMLLRATDKYATTFRPDLEVWFNWFESGRWSNADSKLPAAQS